MSEFLIKSNKSSCSFSNKESRRKIRNVKESVEKREMMNTRKSSRLKFVKKTMRNQPVLID